MPQVYNANSLWKTCFMKNFHEIPSNNSFHMCHNELDFSSYKYRGLVDEYKEHTTHAISNGKNSKLCGHHQSEILLTNCDLVRCKSLRHLLILSFSEILLIIFSVYTWSNLQIINHN